MRGNRIIEYVDRSYSVPVGDFRPDLGEIGRIGRAMTPRCQGLGLKVIAYDPYADAGFAAQRGIEDRNR